MVSEASAVSDESAVPEESAVRVDLAVYEELIVCAKVAAVGGRLWRFKMRLLVLWGLRWLQGVVLRSRGGGRPGGHGVAVRACSVVGRGGQGSRASCERLRCRGVVVNRTGVTGRL